MLKAGALYFAIVVAFFIAVISASLIMLAAHYRNSYLKNVRYQRLQDNQLSGITYVLSQREKQGVERLDLYGLGTDSLYLERSFWGLYELVEMKTFIDRDTLSKNLLLGKQSDTLALYLSDEDRPLSISGGTRITGEVALPKSGLRQAYAEGKPYDGDQLVYNGSIGNSQRALPALEEGLIERLTQMLEQRVEKQKPTSLKTLHVPFSAVAKSVYLGKEVKLDEVSLKGKLILTSDSVITIGAAAQLSDVLVYAPIIKVEAGFKGHCQLFARDSLIVGENAEFKYPSVLGVLRVAGSVAQPQLSLAKGSRLSGIVFSYEKERSAMQTMVSLGQGVKIKGEVFCTGLLKLDKMVAVDGKTACNRFIMRTSQTLYENFLIDVAFNRNVRSRYYLSSPLFGVQQENKVLKWLD